MFRKDSTNFIHWKMTLKLRFLISFTRLFIILVSLTRSLFSEKMLISNRCISGMMSNLIKKSLTDSTVYSCLEQTSTKNFYMTKWMIMTVIWCSLLCFKKRPAYSLHKAPRNEWIVCTAFDCTISKKIKVIQNNRSDTLYCFAKHLKSSKNCNCHNKYAFTTAYFCIMKQTNLDPNA